MGLKNDLAVARSKRTLAQAAYQEGLRDALTYAEDMSDFNRPSYRNGYQQGIKKREEIRSN